MRDLPTLELQSNSTNIIGDKVLVNKQVSGTNVQDVLLFDTASNRQGQIMSAPSAEVSLYDLSAFIYRLDLEQPLILSSEKDGQWALSKAQKATFFLNFSGQVAALASALPSQLSIKELQAQITIQKQALDQEMERYTEKRQALMQSIADAQLQAGAGKKVETAQIAQMQEALSLLDAQKPINFYYQYYRAELQKKIALSMACFMLVFLTFSLSFFRIKHGRLVGFALSMLTSVVYWYLLFFAQMQIFTYPLNPAWFIWSPNLVLFASGLLLLVHTRRL